MNQNNKLWPHISGRHEKPVRVFYIDPTKLMSKFLKQLWMGFQWRSYDMIKSISVASFQNILCPVFKGDYMSVLKKLTKTEKWEVFNGTFILQKKISYHAE